MSSPAAGLPHASAREGWSAEQPSEGERIGSRGFAIAQRSPSEWVAAASVLESPFTVFACQERVADGQRPETCSVIAYQQGVAIPCALENASPLIAYQENLEAWSASEHPSAAIAYRERVTTQSALALASECTARSR